MHFRLFTLVRIGTQTHRLVRIIEANGGKYQKSGRVEPDWNTLVGSAPRKNPQSLEGWKK